MQTALTDLENTARLGLAHGIPDTVRAAFEPVLGDAEGEAYARALTR